MCVHVGIDPSRAVLSQRVKENMKILFEDDFLVVIDKPAGIVVNRAESVAALTVQDWVEERFTIHDLRFKNNTDVERVFIQRSGIAHRLDKETSGALLIAKKPDVLSNLMHQFKTRTIKKEYVALCHGSIQPHQGWFYFPIKRKGVRIRKFGADPLGKEAYTGYRVETYMEKQGQLFTFVRLFPKTGRTHQLRVHLSHYHFPIVSDKLYASEKQYTADSQWCPRHFLHAEVISFTHPIEKKTMTLTSPLANDLHTALAWVCENES
jgi:23S rRNA pseudouridine1911/1915/1917 synthase